jgi:hypothetical protein
MRVPFRSLSRLLLERLSWYLTLHSPLHPPTCCWLRQHTGSESIRGRFVATTCRRAFRAASPSDTRQRHPCGSSSNVELAQSLAKGSYRQRDSVGLRVRWDAFAILDLVKTHIIGIISRRTSERNQRKIQRPRLPTLEIVNESQRQYLLVRRDHI